MFNDDKDTVKSKTSHSDDSSGDNDKENYLAIAHFPDDNVAKITNSRGHGTKVHSIRRVRGNRGHRRSRARCVVRVCSGAKIRGGVPGVRKCGIGNNAPKQEQPSNWKKLKNDAMFKNPNSDAQF